jgi:hypothetical protein
MISSLKTLIRHDGNLYEILEKFQTEYFFTEERLLNKDLLENWKGHLGSDMALKNGATFLLCRKIEDLEFEMVSSDLIQA